MRDMEPAIAEAARMENIEFIGLHFHIGSQILDMGDFSALCNRINNILDELDKKHIKVENINVGGGLGIDYQHPNRMPIPDFEAYFSTYARHLKLRPGQEAAFRARTLRCRTDGFSHYPVSVRKAGNSQTVRYC